MMRAQQLQNDYDLKTSPGPVLVRADIRSSLGPFRFLPNYVTTYPEVVIQALGELYLEYNRSFAPLVAVNREWETDYQYCVWGGLPVNCAVQIDMVGLPDEFLHTTSSMTLSEVREALRGKIFEIENSLAMYQLLENIFSRNLESSRFKLRFRAVLDQLRNQFKKPIALLAVTEQKYQAMLSSEFGREIGDHLSDEEVKNLSGFDRFFSPEEFQKHLDANGGECDYLLYARTSDPIAKLKDPKFQVEHPLLGDAAVRRVIKANSLTFNIDAPDWEMNDPRRINDTKAYMPTLGMAFPVESEADLFHSDFLAHITSGKRFGEYSGRRLSMQFAAYLRTHGTDPEAVVSGKVLLRCKPGKGTFGCYGHLTGALGDSKFRGDLRSALRKRGTYMIQPEMEVSSIANAVDGITCHYIDRNFFAMVEGEPRFLGGLRALMPADTVEAQKGRNHGNGATVWAEVVGP